jgi:hypothetical protein
VCDVQSCFCSVQCRDFVTLRDIVPKSGGSAIWLFSV